MKVYLDHSEQQVLLDPTGTTGQGGFQSLLKALQGRLQADGSLQLNEDLLERIGRYAFQYGNGGWEDRLMAIFRRSLGPKLDGK